MEKLDSVASLLFLFQPYRLNQVLKSRDFIPDMAGEFGWCAWGRLDALSFEAIQDLGLIECGHYLPVEALDDGHRSAAWHHQRIPGAGLITL
ncbi:MAG: hypothetical protein ABIH03_12665, partial [Pseudomonadota bacterium]